MLNVPVNNFSVMFGWSHRYLGITSTLGGGGKYVLLKDKTRRPEWGANDGFSGQFFNFLLYYLFSALLLLYLT